MIRWFDYWLKGRDTGVERGEVRYYVMGAVGEANTPGMNGAPADDFHLRPNDADVSGRQIVNWPRRHRWKRRVRPVSSVIRDTPCPFPAPVFPELRTVAHLNSSRGSNVHYRTTGDPVEWTGRIRAELYMSSTAPDTDVIVRVSDVYPDGRSILIVDYPQRLRYRDGFDHEVLLTGRGRESCLRCRLDQSDFQ